MMDKELLRKKADAVSSKYGLTDAEAETIRRAAHDVYEYVGGDLPPDDKRSMTCGRDTIIEVVLDAGRMEQDLKQEGMTPAMENFFRSRAGNFYEELIDLVGPAFPYERYEVSGMEV